jgi:hypothetical protein
MGFLDDAIREHLDLKRRRGADPVEIERAEREALGPVRRSPEPSDDAALPDEPGAAEQPGWQPFDGEAEPSYDHEPPLEDVPAYHPEDHLPDDDEPLAEAPPPLGAESYDEPLPAEHPAEPPPPVAEPAPPPPAQHVDRETEEYDVEAEHGEEDDDVLESTPEFLQDAPDHDRLWFEQRPPRDFDFDG